MALYEVGVTAPDDSTAGNNRRNCRCARGPPKVLIIDKNPIQAEPMAEALRASDFDVEIRPPVGLPADIEEFEAVDLVVFPRPRGGLF
jgi:hypothetical protein